MIQQCVEDSWRWFPDSRAQSPENQVLCMAGELGEVANIIKKVVRKSLSWDEVLNSANTQYLPEEIVDVQIYLCNLMGNQRFKDVDWQAVWEKKRAFNEERFGHVTEPWFEKDQSV